MIKEDQLVDDIRKIFRMVDKYYSDDKSSVQISKFLEEYFENELKALKNQMKNASRNARGDDDEAYNPAF